MKLINRFEHFARGWQVAVRSFVAVPLLYSIGAAMFAGNAKAGNSYPDPTRVLVVYKINDVDANGNGTGDSLELAQYYAAKRNVPQANLLGVNISVSSYYYYTGQYGLFYSDMVAPILAKLASLGTENLDVILLAGDLPTVVYDGSNTAYSVDNALMGINVLGSAANSLISNGSNPYFAFNPGFSADVGHFNHASFKYSETDMYLVTHLGSAASLGGIDKVAQSVYADKYVYPHPGYYYGTAYVDSQWGMPNGQPYTDAWLSGQTAVQTGDYSTEGNADMSIAYAEHWVAAAGFPLKWENTTDAIVIGGTGAMFSDGTSGLAAPRALFYGGWYNFDNYNNVYQWLAGSIACDLNSAPYFGTQALLHGASAASYVVSEPYLNGHQRPDILYYYILKGYDFAEASALATPFIGWMAVNEGDPLYAPNQPKTPAVDTTVPILEAGYPQTSVSAANGITTVNLPINDSQGPEVVSATVNYGPNANYGSVVNSAPGFSLTPSVSLPSTAGQTYHYQVTLTDPVGNIWTSGDFTYAGNAPPTIAAPASATPSPVTGTTAAVTGLGTDDGGESNLTYTWSATGPAPVAFNTNGTNASKSSTATFTKAGAYSLRVTVTDAFGSTVTSSINVTVSQTASQVAVVPASAIVSIGGTQQFTHTVNDQFGNAVAQAPVTWSITGGGTISTSGLLTAGSTVGGPFTVSAASGGLSGTSSVTVIPVDTTPPTVSLTTPASNATLSGTVTVSATATDNVAVASVQFQLDGSNLGAALTAAPYNFYWNTATAGNGSHTLTAVAVDTSGNTATSAGVVVTVSNTVTSPPTSGLLGYWNFNEDTGTVADDSSGNGNNGTVNGATWVLGHIGSALSFNGTTNDVVTNSIAFTNAFSIAAWVNPAVTPQTAYGRIAETQYKDGFYLGVNSSGGKYKFIVNGAAGATGTCGAGYGCAEGGTVSSGWHLVAGTYNGTTALLYVDGVQVATETFTPPASLSLPLYIGRYYGGSGNGWNGVIDEVRLYNRALTSTEISAIYNYTGTSAVPPTVPGNVTAIAVSSTTINVTWTASKDNVGVAGYRVYRNGTLVATTAGLAYADTGLTPSTMYSHTVAAYDVAGNVSTQSAAASATTLTPPDTTPPTVSLMAPAGSVTLSGTVAVSATATDNVAVASVHFQLDENPLGTVLTTVPYSVSWNTATAGNGSHILTAVAVDTSGNTATSAGVPVTVSNAVTSPPTSGLLGYWNFNEGTGTEADDSSGNGNNGTVNGATWVLGHIGPALSFNGTTNDVVTGNIALTNTFSISAWVNPGVTPQTAYGRIAETQYTHGLYLGVDASGGKYKFIVNGGNGSTGTCGAGYGCAEGGTVSSGWHLVTGTYNGSTALLYVDGVQVATETFTAPANFSLPLYIGRYYGGNSNGWNGLIDEVRLYNRALTSTEISAIYNYTSNTAVAPPTSGLLGYWNLNENTGTVADDISGNGNDGAVNGATWVPGKINSALSFNGTTNDVVTGNIAFTNAFSISTWVNPAVTPQTAYGRIAETQYTQGLYLGVNASGGKYKFIVNGGNGSTGTCGAAYGCAEGGTVSSGWHLVTATYNGTAALLYVDGVQVATEMFTVSANVSLPLYIGRYYGGNSNGWEGVIDEVRLYNRALTSTEISAIYNYTGT